MSCEVLHSLLGGGVAVVLAYMRVVNRRLSRLERTDVDE